MEILKSAVILVIGFVLLIKGADYFVEGSSSVAKKFKVPSLIIGMTIVAMGTSLPELAVSVTAAMAGNNTLAVSNVAGSNIFNLMVELLLEMLAIKGEKATNRFIREEVLSHKIPYEKEPLLQLKEQLEKGS